jgi:hypothetical protein
LQNCDTLNNKIVSEVLNERIGIEPSYTKYLVLIIDKNKKLKSISFEEHRR